MKIIRQTLVVIVITSVVCVSTMIAQSANQAAQKTSSSPAENPRQADIIVDQQFEIGVSDTLQIGVWNEPQLSATSVVKPDGTITVPLLNDVKVAGLTTGQAQRVLQSKYKEYVTDPHVSVAVSEIRSRKVFITGEISRPGSYLLVSPTTVLQLIAQAGGFTPFSKRNKVFVLRVEAGRQSRIAFNYSKVTKGEAGAANILLRPGDTVVVP